jgi:hypothetical protein
MASGKTRRSTCLEVRAQVLRHTHKASRGADGKGHKYPTSKARRCIAIGSTRPEVHRAKNAEFAVHAWQGFLRL